MRNSSLAYLKLVVLNCSLLLFSPVAYNTLVITGNYGNKLDETVTPCSSTTQPTNAVFDGCFYYFLPWGDNKPVTVVDSQWEDVTFRLEALNLIQHTIDRLVSMQDFFFILTH